MSEVPSLVKPSEIIMAKRERIKLQRVESAAAPKSDALVIWYDSHAGDAAVLRRIPQVRYTGVVLYPDNAEEWLPALGNRLRKILHVNTPAEWRAVQEGPLAGITDLIYSSANLELLGEISAAGLPTCYRAYVDDGKTLHASIEQGSQHDFLMVSFRDPTNIPLELVIASLQASQTVLIKEITDPKDYEDALVTLGVMEVGAEGVLYTPREHGDLDSFLSRLDTVESPRVKIEVGTVVRAVPVGMGYRSCIDLATLFSPDEGMMIGSTSQGGILCCPEVFFLPYMELRPFRVNAGAVHSYVYNVGDRTDYMTELRAGSPVMVVGVDGRVRKACVGRMKTEVRPLRLIEVEFSGGERVNVLMQDDWHVRVFSEEGQPFNITELKPGSRVLGHVAKPGRHVGIRVDENIVEN